MPPAYASTLGLTSTGSTNYPTAKTITANGNVQVDTAQSKFGGASALFDGNGDYLSLADSADWFFSTNPFTIECWIRLNAMPAVGKAATMYSQYDSILDSRASFYLIGGNATHGAWSFYVRTSTIDKIYVYTGWRAISTGTWYHAAVVRSGNNFYLFENGVSLSVTGSPDTDAVSNVAASVFIGYYGSSSMYVNGWIDESRVSNVARWTATFTPATARYSSDANTVFLDHDDGSDASTTFLHDVTTGVAKGIVVTVPDLGTNVYFNVTSISFYSHAAGNYSVAIYNNSGSAPHKLQWESVDTAASATTWNNSTISGGLLLVGGNYWLSWQ